MRPHRLTLTAFGSFPGTETVDFDALAGAGLFLVHGPTGAGKTTVLDALCFALFGRVPGLRDKARSLRCDHAPPSAGPSVTLEVTVRGRLLRIRRSPSWQRPKLRGSGFTEEKPKVVVEERVGDAWQGLTTRLDEAGDLVGGLLGMNADQFCQVAMLPQGDFARFLRADGEERAKLLERLFSVKIFTQAESWLADHRKQAWREQQDLRQQVDYALQRLEEAAGDTLEAAHQAHAEASGAASAHGGQEAPAPEDDPLRWAGALLDAARAVVVTETGRHTAAEQALRDVRVRFEQAAALADRQRRHAEALTLRRTLDERAEERAELQAVLDDAARADRVLPLITAARQRAELATKAGVLAADALARAHPLLATASSSWSPGMPGAERPDAPGPSGAGRERGREGHWADAVDRRAERAIRGGRRPAWVRPRRGSGGDLGLRFSGAPSPGELAALERQRQDEIARLSELLTEEARLSVVRRDLLRAEEELAELAEADEGVAARLAALPGLIEQAEARLARARLDAAAIPAVQAVRDAAADLIGVERELERLAVELGALERREADVSAAEAELPRRLADAAAALAEVRTSTAAVPAATAALEQARATLDAVRRRDALAAEAESSAAALQVLVDRAQELRERWLDIRQARIDGMAAELARDLAEGRPCAVCGSESHPRPASPAPSAPSPEDERAAESAHESALAEREAAERALASLESRLAAATESCGGLDADAAGTGVAAAEQELARLRAVAEREPALAADLERVEAERERVRDTARELAEALAARRAQRAHLESERARLRARLAQSAGTTLPAGSGAHPGGPPGGDSPGGPADVGRRDAHAGDVADVHGPAVLAVAERELARLGASAAREPVLAGEAARLGQERQHLEEEGRRIAGRLAACRTRQEELSGDATRLAARLDAARGGDATLAGRLSRLGDEATLLREALEATQAALAAEAELDGAVRAAEEAAAEAGFADVADAEAAARPPAERETKIELLRRLDADYAAVESTLADPELAAAAAEPAPDLQGLAAARDTAEQARTSAASARDRAVARAARLQELRAELGACIERWQPAAERHRLAERMASLASGTSGDNRWSMSLSSYVLGERLRQVVDAANERLDHMSGGRYLLRHDLGKTAGSRGRSGGGLGLRVADGWTGVDRDPATLSGGESFVTSLALALGLADVVTAEAGGTDLGTLFVDEGFGTLDEDTLDGVLDILDGLRDGGRAVGIVSHVAELRTRVTAQLKVSKTRTGSTLSVLGAT
ncbi:AAA family ATPase [Nonomuraea pusilla]|uniref:Nuclease SbcCD subunit C n=1 Tax=Nonomuraea pusilla TaxID=46177 RepID=A0A1H7L3K8_9ACTN|nr:AAA family ATPase [Nonomuraea pusilla]SEK93296.1 exonuclease SbcC [Nonomuraea pusilla]